jgi:hypothetical protein
VPPLIVAVPLALMRSDWPAALTSTSRDLRALIVPGLIAQQVIEYPCPDQNTRFPLTISVSDNRDRF